MFGSLVSAILIFSTIQNFFSKINCEDITTNVTAKYTQNSASTELIVSDIYEATIVCIMSQQGELPVNFEIVKPALKLAIEHTRHQYPHLRFTLVARKDHNPCLLNFAGALAAEEFYMRKVSVFMGPACSSALDPVARMASYWNVPVFTAGGIEVGFSRKNIYSSLTRMSFSLGK
jgi:hypothetical protein